ncbi:cyclin-D-binding Myb-like transcription factor 1 [Exaiptasia diaphana]|uniref:Cyclin-D-binding Myb-like transcription factor 1 n=1 Tax=Exaiptasia diaphana TaxID=2652724 RepID=A0A913XZX9_EXADI|nr:cyclin-D-binding Myb-like transcription factor 1 [Exaiptasia diaphana]
METTLTFENESDPLYLIRHLWVCDGARTKRYGLKSGKWSKKEEKILKENLERYLECHNIEDPRKLIFARHQAAEKRKWKELVKVTGLYKELAKGLNRTLLSVYRKALRTFDENNYVGKYSEAEDRDLLKLVALHGRKWTIIGGIMGRSNLSVQHRYEYIRDKPNHGPWSEEETNLLKQAVRKLTKTKQGDEVYEGICWTSVASIVKTRNNNMCREKWLERLCWKDCSLNNVVSKKWSSKNDVDLITRIYESKATDETDIDWASLCEEFEMARSPAWLTQKFTTVKRKYCQSVDLQNTDFEELIGYLYNVVATDLQNKILLNSSDS